MEIGDICIKTRGRNAGKKVVVLSKPEKGMVIVEGANIKKKRCNVLHLLQLKEKASIGANASHADIVKALKK